ncbi:MAG: hypothetical protein RLZZ535_706 [Cyanobacteriota bacterium]
MVEIRYPPPTRNITPQFQELKPGMTLQRIFDPNNYGATAIGFRYYGPLSRFDHQRSQRKPEIDKERGIIYAGLDLSCCLIEVFGDDEIIRIQQQQIAYITLKQSLKLLDLRDSGAWDAGSVASMAVDGRQKITQAWSRYFYDHLDLYDYIDGLIFNNAHNGEETIALYERSAPKLSSAGISTLNLSEPALRENILAIAARLNLLVENED